MTEFVRSIGLTCYTCQPLIVNGRLLGTLSFGTRNRLEYTAEELQLIQIVCDQMAISAARDQARVQLVKLERAAAAGQMAAKIAHEINNPLAALTNLVYLLKQRPLDAEGERYLTMAEELIERMGRITRQTLSYYRDSRVAGAVNLRHVVDAAVAGAVFAAGRKQVQIEVDVARDLKVIAFDSELVQILSNLLANGIHYSPEQQTVLVTAMCRQEGVELLVSDCGPGVRRENLARLFQPFFTTNQDSGHGLGLWISRELARAMGGDIQYVASAEGARFVLQLRCAA